MTAFVTFSLIIDDIVFPEGRTAMGLLGGGGPQTALGMRLWSEAVGLVSGVGPDLPESARWWFAEMDINQAGLRLEPDRPTARAWQITEADGRRTQVWRTAPGPHLARRWADLPPAYQAARGYHLGVHPEEADFGFIQKLRDTGAVVSIEPFRPAQRPLSEAEVRQLVSAGQIFSPNRAEAASLVGEADPAELLTRLLDAGADIVSLRLGPEGALVQQAGQAGPQAIPAYPAALIDATGAGNAFCGGFLVGWAETGDLRQAGLYGAVAASFLVEQVGLPRPHLKLWEEANARLAALS